MKYSLDHNRIFFQSSVHCLFKDTNTITISWGTLFCNGKFIAQYIRNQSRLFKNLRNGRLQIIGWLVFGCFED